MHRGLQKAARILLIHMGAKDDILGRMKKGNKVKDTFALCWKVVCELLVLLQLIHHLRMKLAEIRPEKQVRAYYGGYQC